MPPRKKPRSVKPESDGLRKWADSNRQKSRLLGDIKKMLLDPTRNQDRDMSVLHGSEMCKSDFCVRHVFYRVTGVDALPIDAHGFQLETIFEAGNEIHRKWQNWTWQLGRLRGRFLCQHCDTVFSATSPTVCESCGSKALVYRELQIRSEKYGIVGHADGDIDEGNEDISDDPLVEVKSIGVGTLRMEAPGLLMKHTHKYVGDDGVERTWVDLDRLWRDIRRPLPSHLKQGVLYAFLEGRKTILFLYEFKPTQATLEFEVKVDKKIVESMLEDALDLKYAVSKNKAPARPHWGSVDNPTCKKCEYRNTCWATNKENDASEDGPAHGGQEEGSGSPSSGGAGGDLPAIEAEVRDPNRARATGRPRRRNADAVVRGADTMDGPPERPTGDGVRGGANGRAVSRSRRSNRPGR